ncbi:MAG: tetratricopeptide repeat protein [Chthoniobacteraceae bacterium]
MNDREKIHDATMPVAERLKVVCRIMLDRLGVLFQYVQKREWLFCMILAVVTFLAYSPAWNGRPIFDDEMFVTPHGQRSFGGLEHIWLQPASTGQFYPLVQSVFWLEARLWGDAPLGYHFINIALHLAAAFLLLRVLRALEIRGAWLAASLFALHPVQVESVAWLAELKNTLSTVCFLGAILAWLRFERERRRGEYALVVFLFVLGLMAKTIVVSLPLAILIMSWWKRGKLSCKQDVRPMVPLIGIAFAAGLITTWMEKRYSGAEGALFAFSFTDRLLIAGRAFWFYLGKLLWPANLIFNYPRWEINSSVWWQYLFPLAALMLFAGLIGVWRLFRVRGPLAALLLFALLLSPLLGFINVNFFTFSFVADHFQYLASLAVITFVSATMALGLSLLRGRPLVTGQGFCVIVLFILAILTARQSRMYADAKTAYVTTLERNPGSWMAHDNLGNILMQEGNPGGAIEQYRDALRIRPDSAKTANNLGVAFLNKNRFVEAVASFQNAIAMKPDYAQAYNNLGNALLKQQRVREAVECYRKAIKIDPAYADARTNLADVLHETGHDFEAISQYRQALQAQPDSADAHDKLGVALSKTGDIDGAINEYEAALTLRRDFAEAHNNLGIALLRKGRVNDAIAEFKKAIEIPPGHANAENNLAWLLATYPDAAIRNGAKAVELAKKLDQVAGGRNPLILTTLAAGYAETGAFPEARETAQRALALAEGQSETLLANALRAQIACYESGRAYREKVKQGR